MEGTFYAFIYVYYLHKKFSYDFAGLPQDQLIIKVTLPFFLYINKNPHLKFPFGHMDEL